MVEREAPPGAAGAQPASGGPSRSMPRGSSRARLRGPPRRDGASPSSRPYHGLERRQRVTRPAHRHLRVAPFCRQRAWTRRTFVARGAPSARARSRVPCRARPKTSSRPSDVTARHATTVSIVLRTTAATRSPSRTPSAASAGGRRRTRLRSEARETSTRAPDLVDATRATASSSPAPRSASRFSAQRRAARGRTDVSRTPEPTRTGSRLPPDESAAPFGEERPEPIDLLGRERVEAR